MELFLHLIGDWLEGIFVRKSGGSRRGQPEDSREPFTPRIEETLDQYLPAIQYAFYLQIVTFVAGYFFLERYLYQFGIVCVAFWLIPIAFIFRRPKPTWALKFSIAAFPLSVFSAFYLLETHFGH